MRAELWKIRPSLLMLNYDALEWIPLRLSIDDRLSRLAEDVRSGTYAASKPEIIRAAKSLGLTRPLAFLDPCDSLLYRNIVALAENDLLNEMQEYSRFGRADSTSDQKFDPDSGWFRSWLKRNAQLWIITENHEWIVETDISNFFPSVQVESAMDHLLAHSQLDVDVIRLLTHMLQQFAPNPEYRVSTSIGLPQEPFDCSRIIAHSFLSAVDEEFIEEGTSHSFSRYMDDIAIGASNYEQGVALVARAQLALEKLGLYANAAKTRVTPVIDFIEDHMKEDNDYLGLIDDALDKQSEIDISEFESKLVSHLETPPEQRPKGWERVLRRFASASRQLRSTTLLGVASGLLRTYPGSTRSLLDYAATFELTKQFVSELRENVGLASASYEDVRIVALEFLCVAPNNDLPEVTEVLVEWAHEILGADRRALPPRLGASAALLLAKFGNKTSQDFLFEVLQSGRGDPDPLRRQTLVACFANGTVNADELFDFVAESEGMSEAAGFIRDLCNGNAPALNGVYSAVKPRQRKSPRIWMVPPRGMVLSACALRVGGEPARTKIDSIANLLRQNESDLRDVAAHRYLKLNVPLFASGQ